MQEQDINLVSKMATQAVLVSLTAQMIALQRLTISLLDSRTISPNQAADFLRDAANIPGDQTGSALGKMFATPLEFYSRKIGRAHV